MAEYHLGRRTIDYLIVLLLQSRITVTIDHLLLNEIISSFVSILFNHEVKFNATNSKEHLDTPAHEDCRLSTEYCGPVRAMPFSLREFRSENGIARTEILGLRFL